MRVTASGPDQQRLDIGCSGWNYQDHYSKGGWIGSFYPDAKTKRLGYYSEYFSTAELDATFYDKFYSKMTKGTFYGMVKATPDNFQFSVKVPENITHVKRLDNMRHADTAFQEFLDKMSPLKEANKLGVILIQLPPSFTVSEFKQTEGFLDKLPHGYDYAMEFRHPSWQTEGPWELLRQGNVAAVATDSPEPKLGYLSKISITANHVFIRLHGRNKGFWYNYLYGEDELIPWTKKVKQLKIDPNVKRLRIYFNNHYAGAAMANALEFREMVGEQLRPKEEEAKNKIKHMLAGLKSQRSLEQFQ
jgi:uncharacterized protein YecE (DUF72 family)